MILYTSSGFVHNWWYLQAWKLINRTVVNQDIPILASPPKLLPMCLPRLSFYLALSGGSLLWPLGCIWSLCLCCSNCCRVCYLPFCWLLFSMCLLLQLLFAAAAARAGVILEAVVLVVVVVLIAILVCALDRPPVPHILRPGWVCRSPEKGKRRWAVV